MDLYPLIEVTLRSVPACMLVRSWLIESFLSLNRRLRKAISARRNTLRFLFLISPFAFFIRRRENKTKLDRHTRLRSISSYGGDFSTAVLTNSCSANGKLFSRTVIKDRRTIKSNRSFASFSTVTGSPPGGFLFLLPSPLSSFHPSYVCSM